MIGTVEGLDCSKTHIFLREPSKLEDNAEYANIVTKDIKKNRIDELPTT